MNFIFLVYKSRNNVPITTAVPLFKQVDPLVSGVGAGALVVVGGSSSLSQIDPNGPAQATFVHFPSPDELPPTQSINPVSAAIGLLVAQQPKLLS